MRFMLTFRIPMEQGNAAVKDGSIAQTIQSILEELKPEAAYTKTIAQPFMRHLEPFAQSG
jgi:hypothetical protein